MNARQKRWRKFRQKWLRDDAGAQTYEPATTAPGIPLSLWPARRTPRRVVFLSKDLLYRSWVDRQFVVPPDWTVVARFGFPDEPLLALLAGLHKQLRVPWCFVGDLDPLDLSVFLAMRALAVDFVGHRQALPMTWVGINDPWLALCRRWLEPGKALPALPMESLEREHWSVLREVAPELPAIIGPESARLLDGGKMLDIAGASGGLYRVGFPAQILKHLVKRVHLAR